MVNKKYPLLLKGGDIFLGNINSQALKNHLVKKKNLKKYLYQKKMYLCKYFFKLLIKYLNRIK
jgi:hypothetical protein